MFDTFGLRNHRLHDSVATSPSELLKGSMLFWRSITRNLKLCAPAPVNRECSHGAVPREFQAFGFSNPTGTRHDERLDPE